MITDLALILIVASVVTLLFKWLKQPLVLGYIVAGFLVSPHMPYVASVVNIDNVHEWADIGVMFLLFTLGLEFSFKKILKMGIAPVIAALTIIFCMITLGVIVGHAFGWSSMNCIFLGGMLSMSSTTIIYKAFDELGLRQQRFTSLVMSVLILEDILAIVMMVMLSGVAINNRLDGTALVESIVDIAYFIVACFIVGIFILPWFLRRTRRLLNAETLLVLALGLCCAMAVISRKVGFSEAFGAFIMGSILAETVEAEKIEHLVAPVKNLFGAIFFVSVGMLVDPAVLVKYAAPIFGLVATILVGQTVFGTFGYLLSGQSLRTAMRCGFSMAQIGEFAFIIASLGLSLHVTGDFLYPVVVAVSVITTFLTPYMIRLAVPAYGLTERVLSPRVLRHIDKFSTAKAQSERERSLWRSYLMSVVVIVLLNGVIAFTIGLLMDSMAYPLIMDMLPAGWNKIVYFIVTLLLLAPFLRSMAMKKANGDDMKQLISENRLNAVWLLFLFFVRVLNAMAFVFILWDRLWNSRHTALMVCIAFVAIIAMMMSRHLKRQSIELERVLLRNLQSREIAARAMGRKRPLFEGRLADLAIHISEIEIPLDSLWAGKTLAQLAFGQRFGVHVSSILRGQHRINIPGGDSIVFPGDKLQVIGNDDQLSQLSQALNSEVLAEEMEIESRETLLRQITLEPGNPLIGKSLSGSGLREDFGCMLVGVEQGQENLTQVDPQHIFQVGDILWVVGEEKDLETLSSPLPRPSAFPSPRSGQGE